MKYRQDSHLLTDQSLLYRSEMDMDNFLHYENDARPNIENIQRCSVRDFLDGLILTCLCRYIQADRKNSYPF
jgi:hypothetical protein